MQFDCVNNPVFCHERWGEVRGYRLPGDKAVRIARRSPFHIFPAFARRAFSDLFLPVFPVDYRNVVFAAYRADNGEALAEAALPAEAYRRIGGEYHCSIISRESRFDRKIREA